MAQRCMSLGRSRLLFGSMAVLVMLAAPIATDAAGPLNGPPPHEGVEVAPQAPKATMDGSSHANVTYTKPTAPNATTSQATAPGKQETSLKASAGTSATTTSVSTASANLQYYPLPYPIRLLDTRAGYASYYGGQGPHLGGFTYGDRAAGISYNGVTFPANTLAITGNCAVVNNTTNSPAGYVTLFPDGSSVPLAANLNYVQGQVVPNAFTVGLNGGSFDIFQSTTIDIVIDISGYYAPIGGGLYFHRIPFPIRLIDTRAGYNAYYQPNSPIGGGTAAVLPIAGITYNGVTIPGNATAIAGNAAVVDNTTNSPDGYVTLYPRGNNLPLAANLNYVRGQVVPNFFISGLGGGALSAYVSTTIDFVVDIEGYYSPSSSDVNGAGTLFNTLSFPVRLLDTRVGYNACLGGSGPHTGGNSYIDPVAIPCTGIPSTAVAVQGNAAVVNNTTNSPAGYVTLYPGNTSLPLAANLNYVQGQVVPNAFIVGLGNTTASDGTPYTNAYRIFSSTTIDEVVDIGGYFT